MKAAFIDRDGVINKEVGYLHRIEDFQYIEGLKGLIQHGFAIIIVTNQAGIAKGYYKLQDYNKLTNWMVGDLRKHGVNLTDILFCPHHPNALIEEYRIDCPGRKPSPGMFCKAERNHNINMQQSIVIGDKITDIEAGKLAGVGRAFLVKSGYPIPDEVSVNVQVADDLFEVSQIISCC